MRLVACIARNSGCVIRRYYLGEGFWLGAISFVTAGTENGSIKLRRFNRAGIFRVVRRSPVAGLASHHDMLTLFF